MEKTNLKNAAIDDKFINVTWSNDNVSQFPCVWLRDNCQSEDCFHPNIKARLITLKDVDTEEIPERVKINNEGELEVLWKDNHISLFKADWLDERRFEDDARHKRLAWLGTDMEFWGSEMQNKIPEQNFHEILNDDNECYLWLRNLEKYGLVLIKEAPREVGQLKKLGQRVSFLKQTHYGETFQVKVKPNPNNAAYTSGYLDLHTDLCYYDYVAGMQMLHCIENEADGGENEFCDGFYVANQLRDEAKMKFDILRSVGIDFWDIGEDSYGKFHKIHRCPTIWDSYIDGDSKTVLETYEALKAFHKLLHDARNKICLKLKPGEIICFHNFRVLHGRKAFTTTKNRHLEGGYIDWDEIHDKMRVLRSKLKI